MELSIVLFFVALLVPGLWLVFIIGREFRQRQGLNDQRRLEQERGAYISARRRAPPRSAAYPKHPAVDPFAQATASVVAPALNKDAALQGLSSAQGDSRHDRTTPHTWAAFEGLPSASPQTPADPFMTSQIDEAFEQFLSATRHGDLPRATRQESSNTARS